MDQYVGLDVSLKEVNVCVLDAKGTVAFEGRSASDPASLAALIRAKAPRAVKIGLETGSTSGWLAYALTAEGLPVVCMDARHAHAALSIRPSKTDRSDARGLAEMVRRDGAPRWCAEMVRRDGAHGLVSCGAGQSLEAHERRALLAARHRLVVMRVDLDGQIRGILKTFGLIVGPGNSDAFLRRAEALAEGHPVLAPLVVA